MTTKTASARTFVAIAGLFGLAVLFASLGLWQLERADRSRATLAQFAGGAAEPALARLPRTLGAEDRFRRVEVRGEYLGERQFLLDNMLHEGMAGYHVLTPLRVPGVSERLLVNRGWVELGGDRSVLPNVDVDDGQRIVTGRLERLPRPGMRLEGANEGAQAAQRQAVVLHYPTAEELARLLSEPVFDYQLLLDPTADEGFVREWRAPGVAPERNLSYAGQWLALAAGSLAAAIVMAVRTSRRKP